ncbi:FecR family protein [Stieleria sp. ICT_E10.1]|uniref:FecR family protein n=1 Tax=Stieleria sedimenti TaxID=2976331 RepID=UPI0021807BE2|nr:FecR family protein [Stieleria sedimenti]MCS7467632.1 FecR family protein [Stieleria sedimenti]
MKRDFVDDPKWQELLSAVCDGRATETQLAELGESLRDPAAQSEYLRYIDMHAALADETLPQIEANVASGSVNLDDRLGSRGPKVRRWTKLLALSASAVAACLLLTFGIFGLREPRNVARTPVATLLLADQCTWEGIVLSEGERLHPDRFQLNHGSAVLRTESGAELAITGPSSFRLQTAERVLVLYGNVVIRATDGAEGFVVDTPTSHVVDLGTEFAVKVARGGETEVHVMDGRVSYRGKNSNDELSKILRAGQGVAIDKSGTPRAVPMNAPRFREFLRRVNPMSRADLLIAYEGFNYSPGVLLLAESKVGIGWEGPWRRRLPAERREPSRDASPEQFEIVHGQMNVTWPVPGGRLGMLKLSPGNVFCVRPLKQAIDLSQDGVTYFSLMVREIERPTNQGQPWEHLRLTFRSSKDYFGDSLSFGHGPSYRPRVQAGGGQLFTSPMEFPAEQTTLWIGKVISRASGEDEVYFRIYGEHDVLDYAEPATWHVVTRDIHSDARLDRVLLSSTGKFGRIVDELRIGPTWRSVAPMKEMRE